MLRVRPIVFTPNFDAFSDLFTALGLRQVEDAPGWRVFTADSGHVALHVASVIHGVGSTVTLPPHY